jgi:transposase-like protein
MLLNCKKCGSPNLVKSGKTKYGTQRYLCKECHYHGTVTGGKSVKDKTQPPCSICGNKGYSKGLCQYHYHQQRYLEKKKN